MKLWRAPLYEVSKYSTNYESFKNVRGSYLSPLPPVRPCEFPWSPEAAGVTYTPVPTADEWEDALKSVVKDGFPSSEAAPVSAADSTLAEEKGWVFEALESIMQGGEAAYLQLLESYMSREKAPSSSGLQPQSIDMLRVAEELDNVPGNQYGSSPLNIMVLSNDMDIMLCMGTDVNLISLALSNRLKSLLPECRFLHLHLQAGPCTGNAVQATSA